MRPINLKDLDRLFYPVVPVVVTAESGGRVGGMLAAWWSQLSFNPPLIGVAIAPERYTYRLIKESGIFGLNLLDFKHVDRTPYLGDVSERFLRDKIKKAGFTIFKGPALGAPLLKEASAAVEARLTKIVETGDHDLFVGRVEAAYAIDDFDGMWKLRSYRPLMYLGRTRRPGPVYRFYISAESYEKRMLEFAGDPLKRYHVLRIKAREAIFRVVREVGRADVNEVAKKLGELMKSYGLDTADLELYLKEAIKAGLVKEA